MVKIKWVHGLNYAGCDFSSFPSFLRLTVFCLFSVELCVCLGFPATTSPFLKANSNGPASSSCQYQQVAGRPIGGRCCERQSVATGCRVCGAKVCCAGLEAGLARGALGPLPLPFEIAARSPKIACLRVPAICRLTDRRTPTHLPSTPLDHRCAWDWDC